ncbi:hypothetical protein D9M68_652470 [compost metagenome]
MVEGGADLTPEGLRMHRRHHALPLPDKQRLPQPLLQDLDLPADRAMRQVQLARRRGKAAGAGGNFKDAQRVERR